jgi:hypothetical protein
MKEVPHTHQVGSTAAPPASGATVECHSHDAVESTVTLERELELDVALGAVERAQLQHRRAVASREVLALLTPHEAEVLGRTPRKLARELRRRAEHPDVLGRVLRKSRMDGCGSWRVTLVAPAPTAQLRALSSAIHAELRRTSAF